MGDPEGVKEGTAQMGHMDFILVATVYQRTVSRSVAGVCTSEGDTSCGNVWKGTALGVQGRNGAPKGPLGRVSMGKTEKTGETPPL